MTVMSVGGREDPTVRGPRLLPPWSLIGGVFAAAAALWAVYPGDGLWRRLREAPASDAVAAILRDQVRRHPGDTEARLALADALIGRDAYAEARHVLGAGSYDARLDRRDARWLALRLERSAWRAREPGTAARTRQRRRLLEAFYAVLALPSFEPEHVARLAEVAREVNRPDVAASLFAWRAARGPGEQRPGWLGRAARAAYAAGDPLRSAELWHAAAENARSGERRRSLFERAAAAAEAAGMPGRALAYTEAALAAVGPRAELLAKAVRLARAAREPDKALAFHERLLELAGENDAAAYRRHVALAVATGKNLAAAARAARAWVERAPESVAARRKLAQIERWRGRPAAALEQWEWIAKREPTEQALEHVAELASALYRHALAIEALTALRRRRGLAAGEARALAREHAATGDLDGAVAAAKRGLETHPDHQALWRQIAFWQRELGRLEQAVETWRSIGDRFGRDLEARVRRMILHWEAGRTDAAWRTARGLDPRNLGEKHSRYALAVYAELAWRHDAWARFVPVQRRRLARGDLGASQRFRYFRALRETGSSEAAVAEAIKLLRERADPGPLLTLAQSAADRGAAAALARRLATLERADVGIEAKPDYWLLKARLASMRGDPGRVLAHRRRALERAPDAARTRAALLWGLIAAERRRPLRRRLDAWRSDAVDAPSLWRPYAAGLAFLGRPSAALPWYERALDRGAPRDERRPRGGPAGAAVSLRLDYAAALEKAGYRDAAWRLRRDVLRRLENAERPFERAAEAAPRLAALIREAAGAEAGAAADRRVLRRAGIPRARRAELAVSWALAGEEHARARARMRSAKRRGFPLPRWQRLALALAQRNLPRVRALLAETPQGEAASRGRARAALGEHSRALAIALPRVEPARDGDGAVTPFRSLAAGARAKRPQSAYVRFDLASLGELSVRSAEAGGMASRGRYTWSLDTAAHRLEGGGDEGALTEQSALLTLRRHGRRGRTTLGVGVNRRPAGRDLIPLRLTHRHRWSQRLAIRAGLELHAVTHDSSELRRLGRRDRFWLGLEHRPTARTNWRVAGGWRDYETRAGAALGHGAAVQGRLEHDVLPGRTTLFTGIAGAWQRNDLVDRLPAAIRPALPAGAGPEGVLAEDFAEAGVILGLGRGTVGSEAPGVASPRFRVSVWLGWQGPADRFAQRISAAVGTRVLGGDQLSLEASHATAAGRGGAAAFTTLRVEYRLGLGR